METGKRWTAYHVTMRDAALGDAAFMYELRRAPWTLGRISDPPPDVEAQRRWLMRILADPREICFIFEHDWLGPIGTACLTLVGDGVGEPGRWILRPDALAAPITTLLAHSYAFEELGLVRLVMCVVADNQPVLKFHERYGARRTHVEPNARVIAGRPSDLVWLELDRDAWPAGRAKLMASCETASRLMEKLWGTAGDAQGSSSAAMR